MSYLIVIQMPKLPSSTKINGFHGILNFLLLLSSMNKSQIVVIETIISTIKILKNIPSSKIILNIHVVLSLTQ